MNKRPVIKESLLPVRRLPIYEMIIWALVLKQCAAPTWVWAIWGVCMTVWGMWILSRMARQEECDVELRLPPQKMTFDPPSAPPDTK